MGSGANAHIPYPLKLVNFGYTQPLPAQPWKPEPKSQAKNGGKAPHVGEGVGWKYLERSSMITGGKR